jgi:hypothetical protein
MSLSHIRHLREQGAKPGMVAVLVGAMPEWLDDGPSVVHVSDRVDLRRMDWLPLVGVWVTVYWLSGPKERALAVVDSLEQAGAKVFGAWIDGKAYPLTGNRSADEEKAIRAYGELLCMTA